MGNLDFSIVTPYLSWLAVGTWWTIVVTVLSGLLSLVAGAFAAVALLYGPRILTWPIRLVMGLFMGTPLLIQLYFIYFGLSQIGINLPALVSGVVGLGLHYAAYNAEIIRAGLQAVDKGQDEAARSIGFSHLQTLRYVVVPQAMRAVTPPLGNSLIALLKDSSLVSLITIAELVLSAQRAIAETYSPFEFFIAITVIYYVLNLILEGALYLVERKVEATR